MTVVLAREVDSWNAMLTGPIELKSPHAVMMIETVGAGKLGVRK